MVDSALIDGYESHPDTIVSLDSMEIHAYMILHF